MGLTVYRDDFKDGESSISFDDGDLLGACDNDYLHEYVSENCEYFHVDEETETFSDDDQEILRPLIIEVSDKCRKNGDFSTAMKLDIIIESFLR